MAYIFGGGTGETAESLKRKREWVQSMLESAIGQQPQNIGDGIAVVGRALAGRLGQAVLNKREREGTAAAMKAAGGNSYIRDLLLGNVGGSGAEISGTGGASTLAGSAGRDKLGPISPDLSARADYIREAAARIGVDPEIAVRVARSEGLAKGVWQSNYHKNGKRETSYGPFQLLVGGGLGDKFIRETGLDPRDPSTERAQVDFALRQAKAGGWSPWYGAAKVGVGKWDGIQRGNNTLPGGEGNDMLMDGWGQPDPNRPGHGINTQTGAPSSFSQPDPARYGPPVAPKGDRLPDPNAMPQFNPMMAQGPLGPQMAPQMAQSMPQQPPVPQPRPQMAPPVDPMQTAAVPQPMMRPRGIVSPRAEDNGYVSGPGAAMQQPGGQGGGLLGRLLSRQPMPQQQNNASNNASGLASGASSPASSASGPSGGNDELMQMYALIDNPLLPESYRAAIVEAIKRKQEQADPTYQADLAYKQAQIRALENPKPAETYRTLTEDEKKQLGLDPAQSYQVDGSNKISQIGGGGVNVNVGDVKVPSGYRPLDPNNPGAGVEPIPGGPAEAIPAEVAGRLGLAKSFIDNFPALESAIEQGGLTGPWDRTMASQGWGQQGELYRQIQTGQDALRRMLTGAGMPAAEADEYLSRYMPGFKDDANSALSKIRGLKTDIENAADAIGKGRGGSILEMMRKKRGDAPAGAEDPLGIR